MRLPKLKEPKRKKKPPKQYRERKYNYWSMAVNWVKHGIMSMSDFHAFTSDFNMDGTCSNRMHWLQANIQNHDYCSVCGKPLRKEEKKRI